MTSLKNVADVTIFDQETREIVVWDKEKNDWIGTGEFVAEPEGEIVYSTEDEDNFTNVDVDDDWWDDDRLDCGCCRCCGCSCYDYDDLDNEESDVDE